jgi:hypothetical protein
MIPFLAALSIADMAFTSAAAAASALLFFTSASTRFERVFSMLLTDLFRASLALACRFLLMADLFFLTGADPANVLPPLNAGYIENMPIMASLLKSGQVIF